MSKKVFNWVLNIISVACASIVIWQFVHRDHFENPERFHTANIGSKLNLPGVFWRNGSTAAVLAVSTSCSYCRASAGFYRSLNATAKIHGVRMMAVLREPPAIYGPLLSSLGINEVGDIRQADLAGLGVTATPTLFLVDGKGVVTAAWVGRLTEAREREVFQRLGLPYKPPLRLATDADSSGDAKSTVSAKELQRLLKQPQTVVLDSRARSAFEEAHITGSLSMPIDEIEERARHELPHDTPIIVFCHFESACEAQKREEGVISLCSMTNQWLQNAGFPNVKNISDDLCTLADNGISMTGKPRR